METIKDLICHEISGSLYNKLRSSTTLLTIDGIIATSIAIQDPILASVCGSLTIASIIGLFVEEKIRNQNIMEIKKTYQEFIKNYNEMNRTFNLRNPAELQSLFHWALNKGYLSEGRKYQASSKETREILSLMGANILMGQGVCRHRIPLFRDILNDYGIEIFALAGNLEDYETFINLKYFIEKFAVEAVKEMINNEGKDEKSLQEEYNFIKEKLAKVEKERLNSIILSKKNQPNNSIRNRIGNHVISLSLYGGESYYLGPNQYEIYGMDAESKLLYSDSNTLQINLECSNLHNTKENLPRLKEILASPYPCVSREEGLKTMATTEKICEQNTDIFEQFYRENKGLYEEVSMRLRKL